MKSMVLKTRRLLLTPLTDDQLQQRLYDAPTPMEKRRYSELYAMVGLYPEHKHWCTLWELTLRADSTVVGSLHFDGPPQQGEVTLHLEILPEHRGVGYAGEALEAMLPHAWKDKSAYFITARPREPLLRDTLLKLGFTDTGSCLEKERPYKPRAKDLMSLGVTMGLFAGFLVLGDVTAGILIGAFAGWVIGWYFDEKDRRIRKKLRQIRQ